MASQLLKARNTPSIHSVVSQETMCKNVLSHYRLRFTPIETSNLLVALSNQCGMHLDHPLYVATTRINPIEHNSPLITQLCLIPQYVLWSKIIPTLEIEHSPC